MIFLFLQCVSTVIIVYIIISPLNSYLYVHWILIADSLTFTRRNDIKFNSIFNSIIIDIDKTELNSKRNVSIIIIYRPPNTESLLFINAHSPEK